MKVGIIGSGPAGLFCADVLSKSGIEVDIFEAGSPVMERVCPQSPECDCKICDILEGEGGAGGLSDGKNTYSLTRGTQLEANLFPEKEGLRALGYIDEMTLQFGSKGVYFKEKPSVKLTAMLEFQSYPLRHLGSDGIRQFISNFSADLRDRGVKMYFDCPVDVKVSKSRAVGIIRRKDRLSHPFDQVIMATGLQGIPEMELFMNSYGSEMGTGAAGFGIRVEVPSHSVDALHDQFYDFKIIGEFAGYTVRSFCCNHKGYVVNENHRTIPLRNVNGHSFLDKALRTRSSNFAIIAKITEGKIKDPQQMVRECGMTINNLAGGTAYQPLSEFLKIDWEFNDAYMTNRQAHRADIANVLDHYGLISSFREFILELGMVAPIINPFSIVYAPEIKYFGRRVYISKDWKSEDIGHLHVIGSVTGYLDSFVSAALSGILAAENIMKETPNGKAQHRYVSR